VRKRIPVVPAAEPVAAARLANLSLEASVDLADVAGAIKDGLLAFASATGLIVMQQMMEAELMARDLSDLDVAVLMIDGIMVAGQCCVAALLITSDGRKVPVGLWLGDTENATVVTALLADLSARGLSTEGGLLVVIDGAKALPTSSTPNLNSRPRLRSLLNKQCLLNEFQQ